MSTLSTKERNKLPDSAFCYVKGSTRLFPMLDASDVTSAAHLIGKSPNPEATKACIVKKARAKGWPIPDAWKSDSAKNSTTLASPGITFSADEVVLKRGKIFEAGEYPDKGIDFTPEDLLAATVDFTPVPMNSGHPLAPSPLDGLMGELREAELADDGVSLIGTVAVPKWLDDVLPEGELKVSAEWDRETKRLRALSYVLDPRIPDAALLAAFAKRHDTHEGQAVIQRIHDHAAQSGAVCSQGNVARMSSRHEAAAVQAIHDIATEHGAKCNEKGSGLSMGPALYSGTSPAAASTQQPTRRTPMSWIADLFKLARTAPDDFDPEALFSASTPTATPSATPAPPQPADTEKDALRAELARERAKGILRDAAAFATRLIEIDQRAFPAEKDAIIAAYTQAAQDDITYGVVTFANGQSGSRVAVLTAAYEARPVHQLTVEQIRPDLQKVLFNQITTPDPNAPKEASPERLKQLIGMTPLGAQILSAKNGN